MFDTILRPVTLPASLAGYPAPCDMFDARGILLLKAGMPISLRSEDGPLRRRIFCQAGEARQLSPQDPLTGLRRAAATLSSLADRAACGKRLSPDDFLALARSVFEYWALDADACIGYVRLVQFERPSVWHALQVALHAAELGAANGLPDESIVELVGAALTMNLSCMVLHDEIFGRARELDSETHAELESHPGESARLLAGIGRFPPSWLAAVAQHHESVDGSGYPLRLGRAAITLPARILAIADVLVTRQSGLGRWAPQHLNMQHTRDSQRLIRHVFGADLEKLDATLVRLLIGRLGPFPPGTLVRLANGEVAVVDRRRASAPSTPAEVLSVFGSHGRLLEAPRRRRIGPREHAIRSYAHDELPRLPAYEWERVWGYGPQARHS